MPLEKLSGDFLSILKGNGFELNPEKIHYADRNSRRMATGIKINEGLNVDRRYVRNIRSALFKVEKLGSVAAQAELGKRLGKPCSIQAYLQGKISWVGFVKGQSDPVFRGLAKRYNQCFSKNPIKVQPTKAERADRAIWVVETDNDTGTAFFLEGVGLVTAAHCIDGASEIYVFHPLKTSNKFKVKVKHLCSHRDLAILEHTIASTEYFELGAYTGLLRIGTDTLAAGFPTYGPGDRLNVRKGSISSLMTKSAVPLIEVSQMLGQGMSGGPLMNENYEVLGIIHKGGPVAYITEDRSVSPQRQLAVAISELKAWASTLP